MPPGYGLNRYPAIDPITGVCSKEAYGLESLGHHILWNETTIENLQTCLHTHACFPPLSSPWRLVSCGSALLRVHVFEGPLELRRIDRTSIHVLLCLLLLPRHDRTLSLPQLPTPKASDRSLVLYPREDHAAY
jgi:hypothetical protein